MFENKPLASAFHQVLLEISNLFDKALTIIEEGKRSGDFSETEYAFCSQRFAQLKGREMLEILEEIYWTHPDLVPEQCQPWPRKDPGSLRERLREAEQFERDETRALLSLLWDIHRNSRNLTTRKLSEELRRDITTHRSVKKLSTGDHLAYYQDLVSLLQAHIKDLKESASTQL